MWIERFQWRLGVTRCPLLHNRWNRRCANRLRHARWSRSWLLLLGLAKWIDRSVGRPVVLRVVYRSRRGILRLLSWVRILSLLI